MCVCEEGERYTWCYQLACLFAALRKTQSRLACRHPAPFARLCVFVCRRRRSGLFVYARLFTARGGGRLGCVCRSARASSCLGLSLSRSGVMAPPGAACAECVHSLCSAVAIRVCTKFFACGLCSRTRLCNTYTGAGRLAGWGYMLCATRWIWIAGAPPGGYGYG